MTTMDFEHMGMDLCRTLLIYANIFIPPELEHIYGKKEEGKEIDMQAILMKEMSEDKKLMAAGDGDSSGGSESEPSEDNLPVEQVAALVPIVDKKQQQLLAKILKKKALDAEKEAQERAKALLKAKKAGEESPTRSPKAGQRVVTTKQLEKAIIQVKPVEEKKEET